MTVTFQELSRKEVIQLETGLSLGRIDDVNFDPASAAVQSFILQGRPRLFGLLGREPDLLVEWGDVVRFGVDAVLVNTPLPEEMAAQPPQKKRRFHFF